MAKKIDKSEGRYLFGHDPAGYDAARPRYPQWIFDTLLDAGALYPGAATLEIGPGTGLATVHLLTHGVNPLVLVEPDPRFEAALITAVKPFNVGCEYYFQTFEQTTLASEQFDLIVCATAFHWLDAVPALKKAKLSLKPGGSIALIWNVLQDLEKEDLFHNATQTLLNALATSPSGAPNTLPYALNVEARRSDALAAGFSSVTYQESKWTHTITTEQVGHLYAGFSQIQRLENSERQQLLSALMKIADDKFNGRVERNITSCLYVIR